MRSKVTRAIAIASLGALVACSAIIGTRDLTLEPGDDGGVTPDGSAGPTAEGGSGSDVNVAPGPDSSPGPDGAGPQDGAPNDALGVDAGCNADLTSDTKNCGACGHDCLTGKCTAGVCQAVTIATGLQGPFGIGLSASSIYWTSYEGWEVWMSGKDGSSPKVVATSATDGGAVQAPIDVLTDDTYVYWMDNVDNSDPTAPGRIARCPLAGCNGAPSHVVVDQLDVPNGMSLDDAGLYWVEYYGDRVASANKTDGGGLHVYATGLSNLEAIVADTTSVYWSSDDEVDRASRDAGFTLDGGGPYTHMYAPGAGGINAFRLAADTSTIYFVVGGTPGLIQSMPKTASNTGLPNTYTNAAQNPIDVTVDGATVYWVNAGPVDDAGVGVYAYGSIMSCPKAGCPASGPTVLASGLAWPRRIVADDKAVYWTVHGNSTNDGAIMRIAK